MPETNKKMINDWLFKGYNVQVKGNDIRVAQDVEEHLKWAKQQREISKAGRKDTGFKPFCNVPDSVALDIMDKYRINIHDPHIQPAEKKRFKQIIKSEYPHLMYY